MFTKKTVKLLALILALVMVFALALTGCGKKAEDEEDASSVTSSTPAPSKPAINEEAREDDTSSNDVSNDNNSGGGDAVEVTREENPAYAAVFAKYGFSEPNVMAGGEFNVVVVDGGKDGVEVNYYFAKPTGEVVSFLSYNIMKRADFVEETEVQDDDSMIELVLETTAQLMKSTYGVDLDYSFNETAVTMSISTTANNSELEVDCIGKQLRDVVAADVADDGVQKYFD